MATELPLIVIVGPTASGKTGLAAKLAHEQGGEVICADSRTVYKHLDVGTAKPTTSEQALAPHWGIDLCEPTERYNAAQFQQYALEKIDEIRARDNLPIIAGGTGLYVDSILFGYDYPVAPSDEMRRKFESMTREELYEYCIKNNIELPEDDKNTRRLTRAIYAKNADNRQNISPIDNAIIVGITTEKIILGERIRQRTEQLFENGVVEEATMLGEKYGWESEAMTSNVYKAIKEHLDGKLTLQEAKDKNTTRDTQLAKRQMTWFRRNPYIEWCTVREVEDYVLRQLASE